MTAPFIRKMMLLPGLHHCSVSLCAYTSILTGHLWGYIQELYIWVYDKQIILNTTLKTLCVGAFRRLACESWAVVQGVGLSH